MNKREYAEKIKNNPKIYIDCNTLTEPTLTNNELPSTKSGISAKQFIKSNLFNKKKEIEITNLAQINEQLIKAQEHKQNILNDFHNENYKLKKENDYLKNKIKTMKTKIKELKSYLSEYGKKEKLDTGMGGIINNKNGFNKMIVKKINITDKNFTDKNLTNTDIIMTENLQSNKNLRTSPSFRKTTINNFKSVKTLNFLKSSVEQYKSLFSNKSQSNTENISLQLLINGQKSLFKYNPEMVAKLLLSKQFINLEKILTTSDNLKYNINNINELELEDFYFNMKGIVNDYKSTMTLFLKINNLLEIQSVFCQRVIMTNIFDKICEIVCQTLECDRSTLYLADIIKKQIWSKASKNSNSIIKLPYGKGIAGYVAESKTNLVLDDAYFNPKFNKEYDMKTGYRTKSVLCVPVFDPYSKEVIGVIQAINKKVKPFVFDVNDEITSELLAKMVGSYLKQSIDISDHSIHEHKFKKLLNISKEFFCINSLEILITKTFKLIHFLFSSDRFQIFLNFNKENNINYNKNIDGKGFYKFVETYSVEETTISELNCNFIGDINNLKLGIIGNCLESKEFIFIPNTSNCRSYNPNIDIDTALPVLTCPLLNLPNDDFNGEFYSDLFGILQFEYSVTRLGINDYRINQVDPMDMDIIKLLIELFSVNFFRILYNNK